MDSRLTSKLIDSIQFTDNIWYIGVECGEIPSKRPPFRGHIDTDHITTTDLEKVDHLIMGFMLYEPQICDDFTDWVKDTVNYLHQSNMFPNLKNIYILYSSVTVNVAKLPDHYMIYGHQPRYYILRSDGTEEKSIGLDPTRNWIDTLANPKAIWLVGDVSNRVHKLPLLYKFVTTNSLDSLDYSLTSVLNDSAMGDPLDKTDPLRTESIIRTFKQVHDMDIDYDQLLEIYNSLVKTLPGDEWSNLIQAGKHSFDLANYAFPKEWNDATLAIMPETWFDHPDKNTRHFWESNTYPTTEKTWKPIATKKPLLGISKFDQQEKTLESLGYRTFRKYTTRPELLDNEHDMKVYIDVAHERIMSFLSQCESYKEGIQADIEYNYQHHQRVLKDEWELLYKSCPPLKHVNKIKFLRLFTVPRESNINTFPISDWVL